MIDNHEDLVEFLAKKDKNIKRFTDDDWFVVVEEENPDYKEAMKLYGLDKK